MVRILVVALFVACLHMIGCSQEQSTAPAPPKPEAKPAMEPAAPAPQAPASAPAVQASAETAKPPPAGEAAKPAEPPKPTPPAAPAPAPAKPAAEPVPAPAKYETTAAAEPAKPAVKIPDVPETVVLPASQGKVTLPHLAHAKLFPCATCHGDGTPGKIDLTKDSAHALCRDCHKAKGAGPTACGGCHQK